MNKLFLLLISIFMPIFLNGQACIQTKIDSILQTKHKEGCPGFSIGIIKNGKTLYSKGYGLANLEYEIENSDSSLFDVASVAKQFTAACVWTLIDEGKLSLDDDIRKYLPEVPYYGDTLRIRHMLNHTSGLRDYSSVLDLAGYDYTKNFFDNQSILELMSRQKNLNNVPGEKMLYGNTPYNLLTIIVERISEMEFIDYATEKLFSPLGMNNTMYRVDNSSIVKNRAVGYIMNNDSTFSQFPRIESCYGGGSLWTTIKDLSSWSNLFTQKPISHQKLVDFLLAKDTLTNGIEANYSRGLMCDSYRGQKTILHGGMTKGYRSQIISFPDIQLSIIILANYNSINPESLSFQIADLFISNSHVKAEAFQYSHKTKELKAFIGNYQEQNSCLKMDIILRGDTLLAKSSLGRSFIPLKSVNQTTLCRTDNEGVRYVFDRESESDLVLYFGANPFYFENIKLVEPSKISLDDYIGTFYSEELDVKYIIQKKDNTIYLSFSNNPMIKLSSGQIDEFGNGYRTKYSFYRNKNGLVDRMNVGSEGIVKNIEFHKL